MLTAADLQYIAVACGAVMGLVAVIAWIKPRFTASWEKAKRAGNGLLLIGGFDARFAAIEHELKPNSGSSLRDSINRIETGVRVTSAIVRAFQDSQEQGMFEAGADGRLLWANQTLLRWARRAGKELQGWGWTDTIAADQREHIRDNWERCVAERREFRQRYTMITSDDCMFDVDAFARPVIDPMNGEIVRYLCYIHRREEAHHG